MLQLLKIRVNGFKLLEDNFTIDLTAKARVYEKDLIKEAEEIDKGLYLLRSNAVVGGNSSGKTTVLSLILKTILFLQTGRWECVLNDFKKDKIYLDVDFYLDNYLYNYKVAFSKINQDIGLLTNKYSPIEEISLKKLYYNKTKGIKNLELLQTEGESLNELFNFSLEDTSAIVKLTKDQIEVDDFSNNVVSNFGRTLLRKTFFNSLNYFDKELVSAVIKLLDESIEYITYISQDNVKFKRYNEEEITMSEADLISILSAGTFRGVELYIRCFNALKQGKIIIVDEIENCFQKNLVFNLLFLFNDSAINKKGAKLFFSTHYIEILDYLDRRDNIFITHKENGKINIKNLYSDYKVRTELLKSKQFDNNVFNTALNYNQLLKVRRTLVNKLQTNND